MNLFFSCNVKGNFFFASATSIYISISFSLRLLAQKHIAAADKALTLKWHSLKCWEAVWGILTHESHIRLIS